MYCFLLLSPKYRYCSLKYAAVCCSSRERRRFAWRTIRFKTVFVPRVPCTRKIIMPLRRRRKHEFLSADCNGRGGGGPDETEERLFNLPRYEMAAVFALHY